MRVSKKEQHSRPDPFYFKNCLYFYELPIIVGSFFVLNLCDKMN
jgi:hypothetical protein